MNRRKGEISRGLPLLNIHHLLLAFACTASALIPFGSCQTVDSPPDATFNGLVDQTQKSMSTSLIAGIIISVLVVVVAGGATFYFLCIVDRGIRTRRTKSDAPIPTPASDMSGSTPIEIRDHLKNLEFKYAEVLEITSNMRIKLGEGGFGSVYYGKLKDGSLVAVKILSSTSNQGTQEFLNEVEILSRAHHKNLVPLIGYCCDMNERCLIYEFMPKGTLDDRLHGLSSEQEPLNWLTRLKIAIGAAKGFNYLHNDCHPAVIHRDVKCTNILLDENLAAKVADFGLSKLLSQSALTHITTGVKGTFGYLDPEYAQTQRLTEKSDVYSFGVILLELLTGNKAIMQYDGDIVHISQWARPHIVTHNYRNILDKSLGDIMDMETVEALASIALQCVASKSVERPYIQEVLGVLEAALKLELSLQVAHLPPNTDFSINIQIVDRLATTTIVEGPPSIEREMLMPPPHTTI